MPRTMTCAFALALSCLLVIPDRPMTAQNQVVSVAVVNFQDDSGSNAPPELRQRLAQELQQNLLAAYKDILPRMISSEVDSRAGQTLTVEQLTALGKQSGASFVIRGGLLSAMSEPMEGKSGMKVQLYAEVISVESGSILTTSRAEGSGAQTDPVEPLSGVDARSEKYRDSAIGLAFAAAIGQLAESVHQAVTAVPAPAAEALATAQGNETVADVNAPQTEDAITAEADAQLQQLLVEAESILSAGGNASTESITAVRQSLEALRPALAAKASLMEKGQDTGQADQNVETGKQALQAAVAQVTAELTASQATSTAAEAQPTAEQKGLLASIDESAGQALSILQKIQEIRTTLRGADESAASQGTDSTAASATATPTEQPVSEGTGVVVDENGNPVEGAQVTDQASGTSTVTDSNGVYHLQGLLSDKIATLIVQKDLTKTSAQTEVWRGRPAVLDFRLTPAGAKASTVGILPSTVLLRSVNGSVATSGTLAGVVRDAQGRPVPRALVNLKSLGVARTNAQGQYAFLNVPAGPHELIVNQTGLRTRTAQVEVIAKQRNDTKIQFTANDEMKTVRSALILPGSATLVRGTIVDNGNHPIAGAKVSAVQERGAVAVVTGPSGRYELRNLKPGPYHIVVSKVGYESAGKDVALRSAGSEARDFQLRKQSSPLIASVLRNDIARRVVIRGRVRGPGGRSVPNATVELKAAGATLPMTSAVTNANGEYSFNAREGVYEIKVRQGSFREASRMMNVRTGGSPEADFSLQPASASTAQQIPANRNAGRVSSQPILNPRSAGQASTHVPPRPGGMTGQVIDAKTRRPIAGVTISIAGQRSVSSDATGRLLVANLSPGIYQVSAVKSGYSSEQRTVVVRSGETATLSFSLTPRIAVRR